MAQKQVPIDVTSMMASSKSGGAAFAVAPAAPVRRAVRRDHFSCWTPSRASRLRGILVRHGQRGFAGDGGDRPRACLDVPAASAPCINAIGVSPKMPDETDCGHGQRATGAPSIWRTESSSCPGTLSSHWVVSSPMPGCCGIGEAADIASAYAPSAGSPADGARLGSELSALSAWSATSGLVRIPRAALQGAPPRSEGFLTPFRRTGMSRPAGSRRRPDAVDGRSRAPNR